MMTKKAMAFYAVALLCLVLAIQGGRRLGLFLADYPVADAGMDAQALREAERVLGPLPTTPMAWTEAGASMENPPLVLPEPLDEKVWAELQAEMEKIDAPALPFPNKDLLFPEDDRSGR